MKEYLLLFRNVSGNDSYITTPQDMQEEMPRWQAWIGGIAGRGKLVSTQPIFYEGQVVSNSGVVQGPHKASEILVAGYLVCKADGIEEVTTWSKTCPILKYEQGSVEVREMMPFTAS